MPAEQALGRVPGVHDVQVSLVHVVIAALVDPARVSGADTGGYQAPSVVQYRITRQASGAL
jgi:hypothetical protein